MTCTECGEPYHRHVDGVCPSTRVADKPSDAISKLEEAYDAVRVAEAAVSAAYEKLAVVTESIEDTRERGRYTELPDLYKRRDEAWRVWVETKFVAIEARIKVLIEIGRTKRGD